MTRAERLVILDFIKAFSCSYAMTRNLGEQLDVATDKELLQAVGGLSSGISTMGDTCGVVNGGTIILGKKFPDLSPERFYATSNTFFRQLEERVNTPNCGLVHGGSHLTRNFRRAILTGTALKCMAILKNGTDVLTTLSTHVSRGEFPFLESRDMHAFQTMADHFHSSGFHCAGSVIESVHERTGLNIDPIREAARGFVGGIGLNGTVCGALIGGVLCMGLQESVDLRASGYADTLRLIIFGLIKNDRVFQDEKRFQPARLYDRCKTLYQNIQRRFGGPHCREIVSCALDTREGAERYTRIGRLAECRKIADFVAESVSG
ncbi:MAG: C-GCAxxG-C-C family protein [Thermodesulfobacteriota bacterium]